MKKYLSPVLDVEMRTRVAVHEGLPGDFDPGKLIDLITLEVGVPVIIIVSVVENITEFLEMREV